MFLPDTSGGGNSMTLSATAASCSPRAGACASAASPKVVKITAPGHTPVIRTHWNYGGLRSARAANPSRRGSPSRSSTPSAGSIRSSSARVPRTSPTGRRQGNLPRLHHLAGRFARIPLTLRVTARVGSAEDGRELRGDAEGRERARPPSSERRPEVVRGKERVPALHDVSFAVDSAGVCRAHGCVGVRARARC